MIKLSLRNFCHFTSSLGSWFFLDGGLEVSKEEWVSESRSVMSDSLRSHGLYSPWNSPGQNTGVGSLSLLQRIFPTEGLKLGLLLCRWILYQLSHKGSPRRRKVKVKLLLTLCNPTDCSLPGFSIQGIFQARVSEWVAISFSSGSSLPRDRTRTSRIAGRRFTLWPTREGGFEQADALPSEPPGKKVKSEVAQLCPTLCDPMDCSLPGSSFHGILQARVLEWVAISFSRGSSRPRVRTRVSGIAGSRFNQGGRFQIIFDQLAWSRSCWKLSSWVKYASAPPSPCAQQHCPKTGSRLWLLALK